MIVDGLWLIDWEKIRSTKFEKVHATDRVSLFSDFDFRSSFL